MGTKAKLTSVQDLTDIVLVVVTLSARKEAFVRLLTILPLTEMSVSIMRFRHILTRGIDLFDILFC